MAAIRDVELTNTSRDSLVSGQEPETRTPLLIQYDSYHGATYSVGSHLSPVHQGNDGIGSPRCIAATPLPPSWKADYQDFSGELTGFEDGNVRCLDTFNDLIKQGNEWLKQNPQLDVRTCETITWSTTNPTEVGDTETMVFERCTCPTGELDTYYFIGLRLWLRPMTDGNALGLPRKIGIRDYKARDKELLSELVKRVNSNLAEDPIAGNIISSETVLVPNFASWDTGRLQWRETQCHQGKYNTFIRLFYVESTPRMESLGIKHIIPEVVHGTHETFSLLMRRASRWISSESSIHVTNLKSVHVSKDNDSPKESADRCSHHFREFGSQQYFQVLRVFYVQRPISGIRKQHVINCMTFTPVQTSLGPNVVASFEKMKHTMVRICAWLHLSGAEVFSLESFATPVIPSAPNHTLPEVANWTPQMAYYESTYRKYLIHIRIYLDGDFTDPDPKLLPPLPYSLTVALQNSIQQREIKNYYRKKKISRRRKRITLLIASAIVAVMIVTLLVRYIWW